MIAKSVLSTSYTRKRSRMRVSRPLNGPPFSNSLGDCLIKLIDSSSSCHRKSGVARLDADARHVFSAEIVTLPRPNGDRSYDPVYSMADDQDYGYPMDVLFLISALLSITRAKRFFTSYPFTNFRSFSW